MDRRSEQVREAIAEKLPSNPEWSEAMIAYFNYLSGGECDEDHAHAFLIHENDFEREVLEALLISDADPDDVENVFEIPKQVYLIFRELFFDTDFFKSRLAKISYCESYEESDFGRHLKLRALHLGSQYVLFRFGNFVPETGAQHMMVKRLFLSAAYRAMEANFNPINSVTTKTSVEHAKIMLKAYDALKDLYSDSSNGTLGVYKLMTSTDVAEPMIENEIEEGEIV